MPQCFLHDFPYICMATMQYAPTIPRLCLNCFCNFASIFRSILPQLCLNYSPAICFFWQVTELPVKALSRVEDGVFVWNLFLPVSHVLQTISSSHSVLFYLTFILLRVIPTALMWQPQRACAQVQFAISLVWGMILQVRKNRFQSKRKLSIFQFHVNKRIITHTLTF